MTDIYSATDVEIVKTATYHHEYANIVQITSTPADIELLYGEIRRHGVLTGNTVEVSGSVVLPWPTALALLTILMEHVARHQKEQSTMGFGTTGEGAL